MKERRMETRAVTKEVLVDKHGTPALHEAKEEVIPELRYGIEPILDSNTLFISQRPPSLEAIYERDADGQMRRVSSDTDTMTIPELAEEVDIAATSLHYLIQQGCLKGVMFAETGIDVGPYHVPRRYVNILTKAKDLTSMGKSMPEAIAVIERQEEIEHLGDALVEAIMALRHPDKIVNATDISDLEQRIANLTAVIDNLTYSTSDSAPALFLEEEAQVVQAALEGDYPVEQGRQEQLTARKHYQSACQKIGDLMLTPR